MAANFYLIKVWTITRVSDGAKQIYTKVDRPDFEDWVLAKDDGTTQTVKLPYNSVQRDGARIGRIYDDRVNPTVALCRASKFVDDGNGNMVEVAYELPENEYWKNCSVNPTDGTPRSRAWWNNNVYNVAAFAAKPFPDAPYQP